MTRVLLIRHLPRSLSLEEKYELLTHFGAENVWEINSRRDAVLASFPTHDVARSSLYRLHQLEIGRRRLVVEYSDEMSRLKIPQTNENSSTAAQDMKTFLKHLNAWNPSVNFFQPPPPHLYYKYPEPTSTTLMNIIYAMATFKPLYTQVLHLMNKMSLEPPFEHNDNAVHHFNKLFPFLKSENITVPEVSEDESEISSGEEPKVEKPTVAKVVKRQHLLPQNRKRPLAILPIQPSSQVKKTKFLDQKEIFEEVSLNEQKKISLKVSKDIRIGKQTSDVEIIGEIKKLPTQHMVQEKSAEESHTLSPADETPLITRKYLLKNRISFNDMKILPVFKNYSAGEPSMRLYLKNLAKNVTEDDVKKIYKCYLETLPSLEQQGFDVRVMQEGRMKGQGFVTFPTVEIAKVALLETNGYMLNDRPMVVQFARVSNKKSIS